MSINDSILKASPFFSDLSIQDITSLNNLFTEKKLQKPSVLNFNALENKNVFIIKSGRIKICRENEAGREIIIEILGINDLFGYETESSFIKQEYAKPITKTVDLLSIPQIEFIKILKKYNSVSIKVTSALNDKLKSFQQKIEDLVFKSSEQRIIDFFSRYAKLHGKVKGNTIEMEMILTHQDIADYTALSRQSVTSQINMLIANGSIVYEGRKKVIIPNIKKS
jgi:CRP/FNR family transcriptional regulator, cyclic AMP receptor protein